jgi:acyl carrier protein
VTQKDSTVTVIQYKDTTIEIPGETVFIEDTLFCDSLGMFMLLDYLKKMEQYLNSKLE